MIQKGIFLFCLSLILLISSCGSKSNKIEMISNQQETENMNRVNTMASYDTQSMKLNYKFENIDENTLVFGTSFSLEYKKDEVWYKVEMKEEFAFDMLAHMLERNQNLEITLDLREYYYPLEIGLYRLIKIFSDEKGSYKIGIPFEVVQ